MIQITNMIRDFLWHGGKGKQKKYHLVNWETVKHPYVEGGLQVRDPDLANLALGGKIIWNLYVNHRHPVRKISRKKYLNGASMRNLQATNISKGTSIYNLYRHGLEPFQKNLFRILGNGKKTMLWKDNIMGNTPLIESEDLKEIHAWLSQLGIKKSKTSLCGMIKEDGKVGISRASQIKCNRKNPSFLLH
jgi:hypothetical protein